LKVQFEAVEELYMGQLLFFSSRQRYSLNIYSGHENEKVRSGNRLNIAHKAMEFSIEV